MTFKRFTVTLMTFSLAAFYPAVSSAASRSTTVSIESDASRTAAKLLQDLKVKSIDVREEVVTVVDRADVPSYSWETYAGTLENVRTDINAMARTLDRLDRIRDKMEPWERAALDQSIPLAQEMSKNAKDALTAIANYQRTPWHAPLPAALTNLYNESDQMAKAIRKLEKSAKGE